jgi:hypothetical protein
MATLPTAKTLGDAPLEARESDKRLVKEASSGRLTDERRENVRRASLGEIPWWYNPWAHLASTTGIGLSALIVAAWELRQHTLHAIDFLTIPLVFVLSNFFEWRVHKHVLHRRRWPFTIIYDKHTPMHHMIYVENDMALRSTQEFRLVLMPAAGVLGVVLAAAPFAIGVGRFWSPAAGWLFLVSCSVYMVSYELLHLSYHAPKDSFVGRLGFIAKLRAHHAKHHDPRFMQHWNFNVNVPMFDFILGTTARKDGDPHGPRTYFWRT